MTEDEEIQHRLEHGQKYAGNDTDGFDAYQKVFNALGREPQVDLSPGSIADRVMARVAAREAKSLRRDYIWLGLGIFVLAICTVVATIVVLSEATEVSGSMLARYFGMGVLVAALAVTIQYLDRKMVQPLYRQWL